MRPRQLCLFSAKLTVPIASPVEEMVRRSGLAERTFKRRFTEATGFTPIDYVQRLRTEDAKRRLERTDEPVDEISWRVGYEDAASFRRLFKRVTGMTPVPTAGASRCRPLSGRMRVGRPLREKVLTSRLPVFCPTPVLLIVAKRPNLPQIR